MNNATRTHTIFWEATWTNDIEALLPNLSINDSARRSPHSKMRNKNSVPKSTILIMNQKKYSDLHLDLDLPKLLYIYLKIGQISDQEQSHAI